MSKKKSLILSLALVLIVGLSITAGTFAYFQWQAAVGTQVNVTIEMGGIKMHIEPEQTGFVGLYPTVHCENNVKYGDTLVRIENNTGTLAIPSFKLSVAINPSVEDTDLLDYYKEHVHYAVVALETTKDGSGNPVKGNPVGGNIIDDLVTGTCKLPLTVSATEDNDNTFRTDYGKSATGLFNVITEENVFADTSMLPREYNSSTGEVQGVTFRGEAYSTSYQYYRVYVWIDEGYTTTIIGDDVTDPLQNATIRVTWSENSMLQQVSGVSNVEETAREPGLYDNDGNMVKTWDELLNDNDIFVFNNELTASNYGLTGNLVIAEGITIICDLAFTDGLSEHAQLNSVYIPASVVEIGSEAFFGSALSSVTFAPGSQLTYIGDFAFAYNANLTSIEIPAGVEYIGLYAFQYTSINEMKFKGTMAQWSLIEKYDHWEIGFPAFEVICSDGVVVLRDAGLYDENWNLQKTWQQLLDAGDITVEGNVVTAAEAVADSTRLVLLEGITAIGESAFSWLRVDNIYIPASVVEIGSSAFHNCDISSITFASNSKLRVIRSEAFYGTSVYGAGIEIPSSVEEISGAAFGRSSISSIVFKGTVEEWANIEFAENWDEEIPVTYIQCSNGRVNIE